MATDEADDFSAAIDFNRQTYEQQFAEHGEDLETLFIPNGKQDERFGVKFEIGVEDGDSVLDLGCGFGDMVDHADRRGLDIAYTGVDITPSFIEVANKRYPGNDFRLLDVLAEPVDQTWDWCFCVGALNITLPDQDNWDFAKAMIERLLELSIKGVAVDFLSSFVSFETPEGFHPDCGEMLAYARSLSKRVALHHDYLPFEYTVYIYKDDSMTEANSFAYHGG